MATSRLYAQLLVPGTRLLIGRDILEIETVTRDRGRILYQGRVTSQQPAHMSHIPRSELIKHLAAGKARILDKQAS